MHNFILTTSWFIFQALDKSSRLSEKELGEAASRWAAEKADKADTSNIPEMSEFDVSSVKVVLKRVSPDSLNKLATYTLHLPSD